MTKYATGTYEWAKSTVNCISGCGNDCQYCYAKVSAIRFKTKTKETWKEEVVNQKNVDKNYGKRQGTIMFPSTHDIRPDTLEPCLTVLHKMLKAGNNVLVVSKPHLECIKRMCNELKGYQEQILFRFTIGANDNTILKLWEPNAPSYEERLSALKYAYDGGFQTSVSCEPILVSMDATKKMIADLEDSVTDAIWIGVMNKWEHRLKQNGAEKVAVAHATDLMTTHWTSDNIKKFYEEMKDHPKLKWKETIKEIVGLERTTKKGKDV